MKTIELQDATLDDCVKALKKENILITRKGKPLALMTAVKDLDAEQIALGHDDELWETIERRRKSKKRITHEEVKRRFGIK